MTHVMAKGANISLTATAVRAVLRWSAAPGTPDLDASALLLGAAGKVRSDADFVFYNQPRHPSGTVRHLPKHQSPGGEEITDAIEVDLGKLPAEVHRVVLAGSVEGGDFRAVRGLRVLLHDAAAPGAEPLAEFPVNETEPVSALVCAELYRRDGGWKFRAVGQGYASGLGGLATDFGIAVEEDAAPTATARPEPAPPAQHPAAPSARPAPRTEEPGTYTLAPAVPSPAAGIPAVPSPAAGAPTPPPPAAAPVTATAPAPTSAPGYGYPQQPPTAPAYPPAPPHQPSYGYPQQQPPYGYPQQPAPAPAPAPTYGYPQQPPPYGYPQQPPAPLPSQPTQVLDPDFALPPQGPQFQPR
ncbi:TerD family protein [Kitasatospora sp. NBC_01250]|uniref:TerD family protein n=1 Tax=unclassified Kitasatospora TaxID=2633591 RepID=UPI002E15B70E|nr:MULTISPECIES: TerD family protein [unclassified Kitasatospora]WSJ69704.1 TerD family protein [Kitasatospora sp. NBC_01302]